jgi:hypothetical protein
LAIFIAIAVFMCAYYMLFGVFSSIALAFNLLCLLALAFLMRRPVMWRAWAALLGAMAGGQALPDPVMWVLIDLAAAIIVIFPPRAGFQKVIAWLFAAMMLFELGWLLSDRMNAEAVVNAGAICGWLQLAVLLTWGIDERYGAARILDWFVGPRVASQSVDRR